MKEYLRLGLTLLIISAIAAGLLAYLDSVTAPIIAEKTKQTSYAMYYDALEDGDDINDIPEEELSKITSTYPSIQSVLNVTRGGEDFGKIFSVTSNGYGGAMTNAIILDNEQNIIAYRNISNDESPGFGNIISDEKYYTRYDGKSVANSGELVLGSGGGENEIEAISGS
ncbi:MAG: electron transporter RnfG, partial [Tissierellia bacterium]|nr:electron transporter RnfG [Tissierellia bacterium]